MNYKFWFENCGSFKPTRDLEVIRNGVKRGLTNIRDEYGCTALMLCVYSKWYAGAEKLLKAGADTEVRYLRTGCTAIYDAALSKDKQMVKLLLDGGANPDAPNYWGVTPRRWLPDAFAGVPYRQTPHPEPHIQNAEHLADHHYPSFQIPELDERIALRPGQAVRLYVYGPKGELKQDDIKARITARFGQGRETCYTARVETPLERTHLTPGTPSVEFGPEHVASVYIQRSPAAE
jgi:hypothetical protein